MEKPAPGADEFRNRRFVDIARMVLEDAGERGINALTEREIFRRALTTTSALASIADNIAHKSMSSGYVEVGTTYQEWTQTGTNSDFKLAKRYLIYDAMAPGKKFRKAANSATANCRMLLLAYNWQPMATL